MSKFTHMTTLLAVGALVAAGCGDDDDNTEQASGSTTPPATTATATTPTADSPADPKLEALLGDPADFADEEITVTGEVAGATSAPAAFKLIKPLGSHDNGIVVLATEDARNARDVASNDVVTVTGTVMKVTEDLADRGEFLFESDDNASATIERIESDYVIAADRVAIR